MNQPLLARRSPVRVSYALLILFAFFFLLPAAFRAARLSLGKKENDVKDWLPSDFPETVELKWFADHFVGESFVVATWPGCSSDDKRLRLLRDKLLHEAANYDPTGDVPDEMLATYKRARQLGEELQLLFTGNDHRDWGGADEKWLATPQGQWYYITPDGRLYRWKGATDGLRAGKRSLQRSWGTIELDGQFVAAFGEAPVSKVANPFYNDPSLLCAPLFATVETGDSIVAELASEGGALWPIDLTDIDKRAVVAKRRATQRLTGTLFAPAIPKDFAWNAEAFRQILSDQRQKALPAGFDFDLQATLNEIVDDRFDGSLANLRAAPSETQTEVFYKLFDSVDVEPPPRSTCVLVTLTDVGKENLAYAIGRGVLGGPQGRLLQLAEQSGISPPAPPSMAPPPFDKAPPEVLAGMPPLRMGGPPVDNAAIDEEGTVTLVRLVGYSVLLGVILSYLCFRSIKITVMVFIVGGTAAMLSMSMVWWTDGRVDAILMSMPSLVYVLGLSGSIHVINYYRDEVRARGEVGAAGRALRHAALPCSLAAFTTAIGLVSLCTSNLAPISNFGFYSAIGVIATLTILFSYLPAALETFKPAVPNPTDSGNVPQESALSEYWASVGRWITRHHVLVSSVCLGALLLTGIGLRKIETSVQLLKLFDSDSRIIEDYAWLEDNFGKLVPMELVLRVPPQMQSERQQDPGNADAGLRMLDRVEAIARINQVVHQTLGEPGAGVVGQSISAETFLPTLPDPVNGYDWRRTKANRDLLAGHDELLGSDYLRMEEGGPFAGSELWRVSLRVGALSDVDYGQFIYTLRNAVEPLLRAYDTRDALMKELTTNGKGQPSALSMKERVLVVGCKKPALLDNAALVNDENTIDADAIYLSTLRTLLGGEKFAGCGWLDPADLKVEIGGKEWTDLITRFHAVVWVGGDGLKEADFADAKKFVNGSVIRATTAVPRLAGEGVPDVEGSGALQVIYTGVVPVVYKAQRTLLHSLADSIGLAFLLIAGVMIVLLNPGRSFASACRPGNFGNGLAAGLVSMIPNVFPVLVIFGVLCHYGVEIDIGTMMTASVAMGVAVDDTIHFLSWFRANLDRGLSRVEAVIETYRRVGPAMTQTTIVGGLGLFVFALSTFTPTQRFGTLMLCMLLAALVGDLILLPALLAGPVGRFFKPREPKRTDGNGPKKGPVAKIEPTAAPEPAAAVKGGIEPVEAMRDKEPVVEEDSIPTLRVHFPGDRPARKLK